ncbi:MAG: tRNA (cytidine(34)-2'-O)-methyltransferase [Yaniella sp.]|uniref:tRNA (cytidine(34)-2'-O)-methyltransferase n=1 Tax=Yaniella sp. TaxID=2773929 RepID=UPI002649B9D5|nr:tRNA (cytidine(34)-2'-O)-methyltransferase [Yaniella sp.]MDN5741849.1 tRNA (cytidine(34)-2'-O)-methyltransferase [Yaniella sp.]MDN5814573.1 tRNA (cytidine(34)-2'-O)-methyltransferase [Yaniella sp.]MDN5817569.1 tRNA (cytidine(34)-2'-O)-methyltransferase [Yaniella sp.]MDN5911359.1 tRNA (cytidine(34)-2'-O)-methyltransferase [Yaniella sp.]MDN6173364.1 tRNA (cytidine(34)-2'-O)-methyltransferase [Yaniella sp.]
MNPHANAPRTPGATNPKFRVLFHEPEIPGNTGNAIRLAAITGAELHLVGPLGFNFDDAHLRRAGLDYHDLALVTVHPDLASAWEALQPTRVFAFTGTGNLRYDDVTYQPGDVLVFGKESVGLADEVLNDPMITDTVFLPMQSGRRSLNLANTASIVLYEAWRQHEFSGS